MSFPGGDSLVFNPLVFASIVPSGKDLGPRLGYCDPCFETGEAGDVRECFQAGSLITLTITPVVTGSAAFRTDKGEG